MGVIQTALWIYCDIYSVLYIRLKWKHISFFLSSFSWECPSLLPNSISLEMSLEDNTNTSSNKDREEINGLHTPMAVWIPISFLWLIWEICFPVSCSQYLCPQTLDCVSKPTDCPCPNAEDIKCIIPDSENLRGEGTVVCTRGKNDCLEVEQLMRGVQGKKK